MRHSPVAKHIRIQDRNTFLRAENAMNVQAREGVCHGKNCIVGAKWHNINLKRFTAARSRIGALTDTDHTVPYGTALWGGAAPGTSCQATIVLSLRDVSPSPEGRLGYTPGNCKQLPTVSCGLGFGFCSGIKIEVSAAPSKLTPGLLSLQRSCLKRSREQLSSSVGNMPVRIPCVVSPSRRSPLQASQCSGVAWDAWHPGNSEAHSCLAMAGTPIRYRGYEKHGSG